MRNVYNGYTEKFLTGKELFEIFKDSFYCDGRHHSVVYDITIPEYFEFIKIKENKEYRIFYNEFFCKIMSAENDKSIDFFSYENIIQSDEYIKNRILTNKFSCPECNAEMIIKRGRYGLFRSCSKYPECKGSQKIFILGNIDFSGFKRCNNPKE